MRATLLSLLLVAGCPGTTDEPTDDTDSDTDAPSDTDGSDAVTWHGDVRPVLQRRCSACHAPGGVGPFSVLHDASEWTDGAPDWAAPSAASVAAGSMPPWMPDEDCHPVQDSRAMPDDERALVAAWAAAGFPEGDPDTFEDPGAGATRDLGPADLSLKPAEAYTPSTDAPDDYRCFPIEHDFDEETWLTAFSVDPDRDEVVHHVILYRFGPDWADDVAGWDSADEGPGYTCYGSPGDWSAETVAGWAPGQLPEVYDEGTARRIEPGSVLVMQVHYNVLGLSGTPAADRSGVSLWTLPEGERPERELISLPIADTNFALQPGDPSAEASIDIPLEGTLFRQVPIRGVFPHMHQLGTSITAEVLREDGSTDCLVDIPRWDFDWQQTYLFPSEDPVLVTRRDTLRLTCRYDNSSANQPVVNGEQIEPREVGWGDGTLDEMCLVYAYFTLPVSQQD